jgi:DNA-binding NarL/FixJ family response regulator
MAYKILILEDNYLMQDNLKALLEMDDTFSVVGMYENAKQIVRLYEQHLPDIIISDIDMPDVSGLDGLKLIKEKYPDSKVLILTVFEDNDKVLSAICLGASGYVLKSSSPAKIKEAIVDVINGGSPLTPSIARKILKYFPKNNFVDNDALNSLSLKEKEVLERLAKGYSYKMIASELDKGVETVRSQVQKIYRKLNVQSNAEAIIKLMNSR